MYRIFRMSQTWAFYVTNTRWETESASEMWQVNVIDEYILVKAWKLVKFMLFEVNQPDFFNPQHTD